MIGVGLDAGLPLARMKWPQNLTFAADLRGDRYMRAGEHIARETAIAFSRASPGWVEDSTGNVQVFATNKPRFTDRGLCIEAKRTRLSLAPLGIGGSSWSSLGASVLAVLNAEGLFEAPCRVGSDGTLYARRNSTAMQLDSDQTVHLKVRYRAGTSSNFGLYMQQGGSASLFQGVAGSLSSTTTSTGTWANARNINLGNELYEIEVDFTAGAGATNWMLGVSPRSSTAGQYVDVLGAMMVNGGGPCEWIFGDASQQVTRQADQLQLRLPAGNHDLTLSFDDASDQQMESVSGDVSLAASVLAGRFVKRVTAKASAG